MSVDLLNLIKSIFSGKKYNQELLTNYNYTSGNCHPKSFNPISQKEQMDYVNRKTRELIEEQREKEQREKERREKERREKEKFINNTITTNINYNFYNGMMVGVIFGFGISKYFFRFIWKN